MFGSCIRRVRLSFHLSILLISTGIIAHTGICTAVDSIPVVVPGLAELSSPDWALAENAVPTALAMSISDSHAARVWGNKVTRGQPFLLHDRNGSPYSYVIPYARNVKEFPSYERIFKAVRSARVKHPGPDRRFGQALEGLVGSIGCIEVAANRSSFPILVVRHWLHPFFLKYEEALAKAVEILDNSEVTLSNVEFNGPHELYFNFSSAEGNLKLHAYTLIPAEEFRQCKTDPEPAQARDTPTPDNLVAARAKAWQEIEKPTSEPMADVYKWIDKNALIPIVEWTHDCIPTALTMTAGFWDHYDEIQGTWPGWGRVIDYWFEHQPICHNNVTNVPNLLDEFANHEGDCSSVNSIPEVLNDINGYDFVWTSVPGTTFNLFGWYDIVSEVDNGRPFYWWAGPTNPHTMTGWGYRSIGSSLYVVTYNTWGTTAPEQWAEYSLFEWAGTSNLSTGLIKLWPGGPGSGNDHAVLIYPRGGETISGPAEVSWFVWGDRIKETKIYYSIDGGRFWYTAHKGYTSLYTSAGWNTWKLPFDKTTTKGRVVVQCYTWGGEYIAADGSVQDFSVTGMPDLVPDLACWKNRYGELLITVRNNGSITAGPSVASVQFPANVSWFYDINFPEIPPGDWVDMPLEIPDKFKGTTSKYNVWVDVKGQVAESNEDNNFDNETCNF